MVQRGSASALEPVRCAAVLPIGMFLAGVALAAGAQHLPSQPTVDGRAIFETRCAACHGADLLWDWFDGGLLDGW